LVSAEAAAALHLLDGYREGPLVFLVPRSMRRRLTVGEVRRRLIELGRQGRAGVAVFDELVKLAGVESWLERTFLKLMRETGLPEPALQRTYREDGIHVVRVGFDFHPLPIIVEVGGQHGYMSTEERRRREHRRNAAMQLLGRTVYFFTTEDVASAPNYVLNTLRGCLPHRAS